MSVRIYQLSKELDIENKELIAILQDKGFDVKSASSTIPDIYAEDLLKEYGKAPKTEEPKEEKKAEAPKEPAKPKAPDASKFVKSAGDIAKEKEAAQTPAVPPVKPAPAVKKAPAVPPPVKAAPTPPKPAAAAPALPPVKKAPAAPTPPKPESTASESTPAPSGEPRKVECKTPIIVREFATLIEMKPFKLISELMEMGIFASMNQNIEEEVAVKIAQKHGFELEVHHRGEQQAQQQGGHTSKKKEAPKEDEDDPKNLEPRPPVICVLGHVDHGKTTLLDTIRKANVVSGEAGGITQHVGAYQVTHNDQLLTFIDTPGHAAFSKMRERGANVTDVAILVIAADDSFKPQTHEALKFAQKANVPIVVAINKIDAPGANIDKVMQEMQQNNIAPEDWGGETLCAQVSALKGENIEDLLEQILLQAEILELQANPKCPAKGIVIESQVEVGRGSTATVIIEKGSLKVGDSMVCGTTYCKVKALINDKGEKIKSVKPGCPALVLGWSDAPESGAKFEVVKNDRVAKRQAEENAIEAKKAANAPSGGAGGPANLDNLLAAIAQKQQKSLKVILKGDVHGTVEALEACLTDIKSDKVSLEVIDREVGLISKNDVIKADAGDATIVAFNTKCDNGVQALAKHHDVRIVQHNIIYELIDQVREAMAELLDSEYEERKLGAAEVRQVFGLTKAMVAGCMVTEGLVKRDQYARVLRGKKHDEVVHEGKITTLKRFKDDAAEVRAGYECGIQVSGFNDIQENDIIECFEVVEVRPTL